MLDHLSPTQAGNLAQSAVMTELIFLGYEVLLPYSAECRYDLAIAVGNQFFRVQVKLARLDPKKGCNAIRFWTSKSSKNKVTGNWKRDEYSVDCDLLAAYCPDNKKCYAIGATEAPLTKVSFNLDKTGANGQEFGLRFHEEYFLDVVLKELVEQGV